MSDWLPDICTRCGGHCVYAVWHGDYDIVDCHYCSNGSVWISPNDRVAAYPGAPFQGVWLGRYAERKARAA